MKSHTIALDAHQSVDVDFSATTKRLLHYIRPYLHYFIFAVAGYLLFAASQPGFAMLMERFVQALQGEFVGGLVFIPLACVAIALMRGVGSYLGSYYMAKVSENAIHDIRCLLFDNIIALPIPYFDKNKSGRLISLFTYNTGVMTSSTAKAITIIVREGLTVIALFAYLIYKNPQLTLIFLILGPPLALIIRWVGVKVKRFGHGIQLTVGELNHVVSEVFSGIRLVKSSVAERQSKGRFHDVSSDTKKLGMKLAKVNSIYAPLMQMMIIVAMAIVMYVVLYFRDMMDPAALIAYVTAAALLPKPIRSLSSVHPQLLQGVVAAQEVFEHIDKEKERNTGKLSSPAIEGEIEFKDVVFFYDEESAPVLKKVSFVAPRGSTIALVGRSGGGKSTLVNLIPRFYDAGEGEIKIDGVNLREYSLDFLRKNIAIVSQNVNLFNASIADNIAFGLEQVEITEIKRAAQVANADEFIRELPDGYETMVGENGVLLSGGQRQRLAIARAILRNAPILIMDEATSALDNESEVKVQLALEKVMQDRTTLVIAHRLSTVEHADEILVLEGGEIVERGSHQQLMSRNDVYARMVQRDFMD